MSPRAIKTKTPSGVSLRVLETKRHNTVDEVDYPIFDVYTCGPTGWLDRFLGTVEEVVEGGFVPYDRTHIQGDLHLTLCGAAQALGEHEAPPREPTDLFTVVGELEVEA